MSLRELLGYLLAAIAVLIVALGIWAARYHSPARKYARMIAKERRAARERKRRAEGDG